MVRQKLFTKSLCRGLICDCHLPFVMASHYETTTTSFD